MNIKNEKFEDEKEEKKLMTMKNKKLAYEKMLKREENRIFPKGLTFEDVEFVIEKICEELGIDEDDMEDY
jgi:hypothetical protein